MKYHFHSDARYRRIYNTVPPDNNSENDSSLDSSFRPRQNGHHRDEDLYVWPYFLSLLFTILAIVILYSPVYNPPEEPYNPSSETAITSTTTTVIAPSLTGKATATTSTSSTTSIRDSLQPASPNDRSPEATPQKEASTIQKPPTSPVLEGETQPFVLHDDIAWISYLPSLCHHPQHSASLPDELSRIPGRELGLFGVAHLAPDPKADESNPECSKMVARAASRQRALFVPKAKSSWASPFDWMSKGSWEVRMSNTQMEIVRKIIDAAEERAKLLCMTEKEMKKWREEEALKSRREEEALKSRREEGILKRLFSW
ncbi:uncharacterized protein LTHEOB_2225 [Lasiodiplodia theobromae]|uniref:uncharacterized protein n=1 Tax=Lasiodiplodia theobromae TaxID=45133 RepID=UPI0015C3DBD4|nr:uncharacterized protein LTHEOB_2225 [Lasiodiplodia theobromae]KAF4536464.1 hypothetical protein LTHEOB_2225 [Lasiodiplodia theobromae]